MFPKIYHIDDVLPHIEGYKEFNVVKSPMGYTTINYAVDTGDTFKIDPLNPLPGKIRRECRGIKFDTDTGNIICRPYHKFANLNQWEETQIGNIDANDIEYISVKEDGSMIAPFVMGNGELYFGTKAGHSDVSDKMLKNIKNLDNIAKFCRDMIGQGYTPLFEYIGPENKIVLDYKESNLVLLDLRNWYTGEYKQIEQIAKLHGIQTVQKLKYTDFNSFAQTVAKSSGVEGVVVSFKTTQEKIKIKSDEYVAIHKAKEQILSDRFVIRMFLDNTIDDVISKIDKNDQEKVNNTIHEFLKLHDNKKERLLADCEAKWVESGKNKKVLATIIKPKNAAYFFNYADNTNIDVMWAKHLDGALLRNNRYDDYIKWLKE